MAEVSRSKRSPESPAGTESSLDADALRDGRAETEAQRLDRNWSALLQELRVTQTGTQILTGFLLTLAFQQRFATLDRVQVNIYLGLVTLAALTTALGLTPVAIHRALFRHHAMEQLVATSNFLLKFTLACVGLILVGTTLFIFSVVENTVAGLIAGAITLLVSIVLWIFVPFGIRPQRPTTGS